MTYAIDEPYDPWAAACEAEIEAREAHEREVAAAHRAVEQRARKWAAAALFVRINRLKMPAPRVLKEQLDELRDDLAYDDCAADVACHDLSTMTEYALSEYAETSDWYETPPDDLWWSAVSCLAQGQYAEAAQIADDLVELHRRDERWKWWRGER